MSLSGDKRAQLLANLKCLYGSNVEVLTLRHGRSEYQAVAMRFDPFDGTWTKFLHSEPDLIFSRYAIESLLEESEKELTKLFRANGNTVPFQDHMMQSLTLRRGKQRDSSAGSSLHSEFVSIATPESTLSDDTVSKGHLDEEIPVEETDMQEATVQAAVAAEVSVGEEFIPGEPAGLCNESEPVSQKPEGISSDWEYWPGSTEVAGNKEARFTFNESPLVAKEPLVENPCFASYVIQETPVLEPENDLPTREDFGWGFSIKNDKEKGKKSERDFVGVIVEPASEAMPAAEPEPVLEPELVPQPESVVEDVPAAEPEPATSKKEKNKKRKNVMTIEELLELNTAMVKKDKKKKGKNAEIIEELAVEAMLAAEPELAVSKKGKKKKGKIAMTDEEAFELEMAVVKKDKKKKGKIVEIIEEPAVEAMPTAEPEPVPELELVLGPELAAENVPAAEPEPAMSKKGKKKKEKKEKNAEIIEELAFKDEPAVSKKIKGDISAKIEEPPTLEAVGYPVAAPLLLGETSTEATASQQIARNSQTVVFTIRHLNEMEKRPLQAMIALSDNTRAAIFDAVNSYLDSKSTLMVGQGQRKLKIVCGVGKDGDVDLSTLEETMWPEYLEYFRQYTRLPELTVDVEDS